MEPLYKAIMAFDLVKAQTIMQNAESLDLNSSLDDFGGGPMTLLHFAVGIGAPEMVQLLLGHNVEVNAKAGDGGLTPLHISVYCKHFTIFQILLKAGANPKLEDDEQHKSCLDIILDMEEDFLNMYLEAIASHEQAMVVKPLELHINETSNSICEVTKLISSSGSNKSSCASITLGISDQSTYEFLTDPMYSTLASSINFPKNINDCSSSGTSSSCCTVPQHCTGGCASCSLATPSPVLTEKQFGAVKAAALARGFPILPSTISVLSKFVNTQTEVVTLSPVPSPSTQGYSIELDLALRNLDYVNQWQNLQVDFLQDFKKPLRSSKSFFNYLLLDPNVLRRTNFSGNQLKTGLFKNADKFNVFIKSIFYIGKGTANRPFQHLIDAKVRLTTKARLRSSDSSKLDKVVSIWENGQGVVLLTLFHSSTELESNANEAAMIDAIGLNCPSLTNVRKGSYLNTPATAWSGKARNQFGTCLLHKAYCMYVVSGNSVKVFYPRDV